MMRHTSFITLIIVCSISRVIAAPLSVSPTLIELTVPIFATTITLHGGETPQTVQIRVMRWQQIDGIERLEPATDVVASPPILQMSGRQDYIVRIVRTSKEPIQSEESYRILIDQLPQSSARKGLAINFLVRQSIPAFFHAEALTPPDVSWSIIRKGGMTEIKATNAGDDRLRIAALKLRDASGRTVTFGPGLVGYALGHSTIAWPLPKPPQGFGSMGAVKIEALTQNGPLNATTR